MIQYPGRPTFLTLHHLTTLESSTCPTKNYCSFKNCTQFYYPSSYILQNIGMWHAGLLHGIKIKLVLERLKQQNTIIFASKAYKLKYVPFEYFIYYDVIQYAREDIRLGPHTSNRDRKWVK